MINVGLIDTTIPLQSLDREEWFEAMRRLIPGIEQQTLDDAWAEFLIWKADRLSAASPSLQ